MCDVRSAVVIKQTAELLSLSVFRWTACVCAKEDCIEVPLTWPRLVGRQFVGCSQVGEVIDAPGLIGQSSGNSFFILCERICSGIVIVPCLQEGRVSDWIREGIVSVSCSRALTVHGRGFHWHQMRSYNRPKKKEEERW